MLNKCFGSYFLTLKFVPEMISQQAYNYYSNQIK